MLKFGTQTNSNMTFSVWGLETPFSGKFGPKSQNSQFKLTFVTQANSNMQNSTFFWREFGPKYQTCQFKLKFGPQTNLNMQNSMTLFLFPVLEGKSFLGKIWSNNQTCQLKMKFASWTNSNMPNSIMVCSLFLFWTGNTVFGQILPKKSKLSV